MGVSRHRLTPLAKHFSLVLVARIQIFGSKALFLAWFPRLLLRLTVLRSLLQRRPPRAEEDLWRSDDSREGVFN